MSDVPRRIDRTRLFTWPLAGFLIGLLASRPPIATDTLSVTPVDVLIVGVLAGLVCALGGLVVAMLRRKPTSTAMPIFEDRPFRTLAFYGCFFVSLTMKLLGMYSAVSILVGWVPVWMIFRPGRRHDRPRSSRSGGSDDRRDE